MEYLDIILCFNIPVLIRLFIGTPSANGFSFTVKDSYLASQVMKTVFFKDWLSCTLACQDDDKCASYNFNTFTSSCDLNEQGLQQPFSGPNELVKMQGMIFHQLRVSHALLQHFAALYQQSLILILKLTFGFNAYIRKDHYYQIFKICRFFSLNLLTIYSSNSNCLFFSSALISMKLSE